MYAAKHTSAEIAEKYEVCADVIIRYLRNNGIAIRRRRE